MKNKSMKIRIIYLVVSCFLLPYQYVKAQTGWVETSNDTLTHISIKFSTPETPIANLADSLHTAFYVYEVDSLLAMQVHIFDKANLDSEETLIQTALAQEANDTLRAIASLIVLASDSELTSIQEVWEDQIRGLEISILYPDDDQGIFSFIRYYLYQEKFITFTITGIDSDMDRFLSMKDTFFNSIQLLPK